MEGNPKGREDLLIKAYTGVDLYIIGLCLEISQNEIDNNLKAPIEACVQLGMDCYFFGIDDFYRVLD